MSDNNDFSIYGPYHDLIANKRIEQLVENAMLSRSSLTSTALDPRRDIDKECGYPETYELTAEIYKSLYEREAVATRVVEILPKFTWATFPSIYEDEDPNKKTEFEEAWDNLVKDLFGGETSWFKNQEGNPVWEKLFRADMLSGIGSFGIILLGLDDGLDLQEPVKGIEEKNSAAVKVNPEKSDNNSEKSDNVIAVTNCKPYKLTVNAEGRKLTFLRVFDESLVDIVQYEGNPTSSRFGKPVMYSVTFNDPREQSTGGLGVPMATKMVHWTRIIHIADNRGSSEIWGVPRMRPVYNRIYDLRKLYGGSAEMYWTGALPGWSFETHPQLGGDVNIDMSSMRDNAEKYFTGLQRWMTSSGMSVKSLSPEVVDPSPQIERQIEAICIILGIPKRIFMGSERGELSSGQDKNSWNEQIAARQNGYVTPCIIVPFIDRLILIGVLPKPKDGYSVQWPDLNTMGDIERADFVGKTIEAMAKYIGGNVESLIPPMEFLTKFLNMSEEEAESILEAANEILEEQEQEQEQPFQTGPGGHVPDGTGPHGRGMGPGEGKADGSGRNAE